MPQFHAQLGINNVPFVSTKSQLLEIPFREVINYPRTLVFPSNGITSLFFVAFLHRFRGIGRLKRGRR